MADSFISLMQPHFFPAYSYFDLASRCEQFVFLSNVQLSKQSFQTRNRIIENAKLSWINCSIQNTSSTQLISDTCFSNLFWKEKLLRRIEHQFTSYKFRSDLEPLIKFLREWTGGGLCDFNIGVFEVIANMLEIHANILQDKTLELESGRSERIIDLMSRYPKLSYLYTSGSRQYMQDDNLFKKGFLCYEYKYLPLEFESDNSRVSIIESVARLGWIELRKRLGKQGNVQIFNV